jgi:hypothetical protein
MQAFDAPVTKHRVLIDRLGAIRVQVPTCSVEIVDSAFSALGRDATN